MGRRKAPPGTATPIAPATTRCSCSTSSATWSAASFGPCNVHSADGWEEVLKPVMDRYADKDILRLFRADAAFAISGLYVTLETAGYFYAIRLLMNTVLQEKIADLLKRPVGRPPNEVRGVYGDFEYQAGSWEKPRRMLA
jgi:hypothetical protein